MKREMSVEMRLGEMEDYKGHIKQDLVSRIAITPNGLEFITLFFKLNSTEHDNLSSS